MSFAALFCLLAFVHGLCPEKNFLIHKNLLIFEHMFAIMKSEEKRGGNGVNLEIEMISVFAADGGITPLRFRIENELHGKETIIISKVVSEKPIQYAGIDAIHYLCKAVTGNQNRLYELRYTISTHRWTLFRVLY